MKNFFKLLSSMGVVLTILVVLCFLAIFQTGCSTTTTQTPTTETPSAPPASTSKRVALNWENTTEKHPERAPWSDELRALVKKDLAKFKKGSDLADFCPNFKDLDTEGQVTAISTLIVAVIFYESGYNPTSYMVETSMGVDPVTGKQVISGGLLQLSYQDIPNYKNKISDFEKCGIDYEKDKNLALNSSKRTLLNPLINLRCGVPIMAYIVNSRGKYVFSDHHYWAVLKPGHHPKDIQRRVQQYAPGCI